MDSENNQIKKKRGRKPKEKTIEEIEKIPKKRGRKPTGKLIKLKWLVYRCHHLCTSFH